MLYKLRNARQEPRCQPVIADSSGTEIEKNSTARIRAWIFWIDGGLHALFLIVVLIVLLRA
jgi:hypothetical protein